MIALLLTGCAPWVFDARIWDCEDRVSIVAEDALVLTATDAERCEARVQGLSSTSGYRDGPGLVLEGASDVVLRGRPVLDASWPSSSLGSSVRLDRDEVTLELSSLGAGELSLEEQLVVDCEGCALTTTLSIDFDLALTGSGHSRVCILDGSGAITFGSGVLEVHGNTGNAIIQGDGILLTSGEDLDADVPVVGYIPSRDCGGEP